MTKRCPHGVDVSPHLSTHYDADDESYRMNVGMKFCVACGRAQAEKLMGEIARRILAQADFSR